MPSAVESMVARSNESGALWWLSKMGAPIAESPDARPAVT